MGSANIFKPLSAFLQAAPLMNLSNIDNFLSEIIFGKAGNRIRGLGLEASFLTIVHCYLTGLVLCSSLNANAGI